MNAIDAVEEFDAPPSPSHVYFVYSEGRIKIGHSRDWLRRVQRICNQCPGSAEPVGAFPGGAEEEKRLHILFADHAAGGEWFRFEGALKATLLETFHKEARTRLEDAHAAYERDLARR